MPDTIFENKKTFESDSSFGSIFADKTDMASDRDIKSDVRNWNLYSISTFFSSLRNNLLPNYTTLNKKTVYSYPLSLKIGLVLLAGWETFVVQNIVVQWGITIIIFLGSLIWLYDKWLSVRKKKLILTNTGKIIYTRWMKIAGTMKLQKDINRIILNSFLIATLIVVLVLIYSK